MDRSLINHGGLGDRRVAAVVSRTMLTLGAFLCLLVLGWSALIFNEYCYVYRSLYPVKVTDVERARRISLMQVSLKTQSEIRRIQEGKH